jgi:hypothetical protein
VRNGTQPVSNVDQAARLADKLICLNKLRA